MVAVLCHVLVLRGGGESAKGRNTKKPQTDSLSSFRPATQNICMAYDMYGENPTHFLVSLFTP